MASDAEGQVHRQREEKQRELLMAMSHHLDTSHGSCHKLVAQCLYTPSSPHQLYLVVETPAGNLNRFTSLVDRSIDRAEILLATT